MWRKIFFLFVLTAVIEGCFVFVYYHEARGPLADAIAEHTATLTNGTIPPANSIDIHNDPWVKVAHFESSFYQVQLLVDMVMALGIAFILIFGGISNAIARKARQLTPNRHLGRSLYLMMLSAVYAVINVPLSVSGFLIETVRGTSFPTIGSALFVFVQDFFVGLIFILIPFIPLYWIMDRYKKWWWAIGAAFFSAYSVFSMFLGPILIDPLYYAQTPLENEAVRRELADIVEAAGVPPERIFVTNASDYTLESNAWVTGLGATKRILLDDTLITFYSPREIRTIVAHEIGHYELNHLWYDSALYTVLTFISFASIAVIMHYLVQRYGRRIGAYHVSDIVLYPALSILLFMIPTITAPVQSYVSRTFEHEADVFEVHLAHDPQASIDSFKKMSYQSFIDVDPPEFLQFWFGTHPTVLERLEYYESQK